MRKESKKFALIFERQRNTIEKKGIRMAKSALVEQYKSFIQKLDSTDFAQWENIRLDEKPISKFLTSYYKMSAQFGLMQYKHMLGKKAGEEDAILLSQFDQKLVQFLREIGDTKIQSITATSKSKVMDILRDVLAQGEIEGLGIDAIKTNLISAIGSSIRGNVEARAKAIAQTEIIQASNRASNDAAEKTGLEYRKFWSTSHLEGIRPSHSLAEQDSISRGGLSKNELHSNGLLYVGDPSGPIEEIINCRCTEIYEIV